MPPSDWSIFNPKSSRAFSATHLQSNPGMVWIERETHSHLNASDAVPKRKTSSTRRCLLGARRRPFENNLSKCWLLICRERLVVANNTGDDDLNNDPGELGEEEPDHNRGWCATTRQEPSWYKIAIISCARTRTLPTN